MSESYNDSLDADDQVSTEELIASLIFDVDDGGDVDDDPIRLPEHVCSRLGRDILLAVLTKFRPDLVTE